MPHPESRWFLKDEDDNIHYRANPGPQALEVKVRTAGELWRLMEPLRRLDEDGNIYDLVRVFFEEYGFFPFSPRDDLIDAMSRIHDMDPMPAVMHEQVEVEDYVDA